MIKAFAVTLLIAFMGSSISEFSLSPGESFTFHAENDYVFTVSECGSSCISLHVSQMHEGTPAWTGQLFDLHQGRSYPLQMDFEDVIFDSVYVVSVGEVITLRVSYREPAPAVSHERVVKAASEKKIVEKVSLLIIGELCAVIFLVFFVAHRLLRSKGTNTRDADHDTPTVPRSAVGFHDSWQPGIPKTRYEDDTDLELLEHIRELENLKEMEMHRRIRRRQEEEDSLGLDWI